jgi:hypothetical protein
LSAEKWLSEVLPVKGRVYAIIVQENELNVKQILILQ